MSWLEFVILCLAAYRVTMLFTDDTEPYDIFLKLRQFLKREAKESKAVRDSKVHKGMECIRCAGIWLALGIALYTYWHPTLPEWFKALGDGILLALALNGVTIILWRAFPEKP